jgi:hypothetical protein
MSEHDRGQAPSNDPEARAWDALDDHDELDDAIIAADDTGMVSGAAAITLVEEEEHLKP